MQDTISQAKARAAAIIAKAEREVAVAGMLPNLPTAPMIVLQKDCVWLVYRPETFGDILTIFDAFRLVPFCVTKKNGWAATTSRGEVEGAETKLSDGYAWCSFTQYADLAPSFKFRAMGDLPDGTPCEVHVEFEGGHWRKGAWHRDLAARFVCENPHHARMEYNLVFRASSPAFMGQAAFTWYSGTGRNNGSGMCGNGAFMTRDCLARAIETLEASA